MTSKVQIGATRTVVTWSDGSNIALPNLWLRDNCSCSECRIDQTTEKKFLIARVEADIQPKEAVLQRDVLTVVWPDNHATCYSKHQIAEFSQSHPHPTRLWKGDFAPVRVDYRAFLADDSIAASAINEFLTTGALVITAMPGTSAEVENLQPRLGRIRDMPFGRLHEVKVDPEGYNVAHTSLPLPPHNDFASTNWPPSIQALHMLVNECEGGESVIVDGWSVAEQLRLERPELFDVLCTIPVPFRMFSDDEETLASNPIIRLDVHGQIAQLRYSNQLMQPLDPLIEGIELFYQAYHELTRRLVSDDAKAVFRLESEECLLVAGHRVLHAREAFSPTGRRHLQDAYFEHDCCRNHLTVIERKLGKRA